MNSFRRGKVYELEAKNLLSRLTNEEWRRLGGREVDKVTLSGDVCSLKPDSWYRQFSVEVKARKSVAISDWLDKCIDDSRGRLPIVLWWDNKTKRWVITLEAEKFIRLTEQLKGYARGE